MIPLYKPFMPPLPELENILRSGQLTYGNYTKQFEQLLRKYFETELLLVTNSFNTAISVVVSAMELKYADEIIASPVGCLASTQPYLTAGLNVRWADVNPKSGVLDADSVKKVITTKTKAIIHNHFCGYPGDIDTINQIASENNLFVVDDGIECFGSEYKENKVGNCGSDFTVFSLTAVRNPNAIDGGVIIFKDKAMFEKAVLIRDCGIDRNTFRGELGEININSDIYLKGFSATMSDVNGYIGAMQMQHINEIHQKSRNNALMWESVLKNLPDIVPLNLMHSNPNYWVFGTLTQNKEATIKKFRADGFYASGVHTNNSNYSVFGKDHIPLPGTEQFCKHFVALPCGWWVEKSDFLNVTFDT